jgi:uncharacterized membrane protein
VDGRVEFKAAPDERGTIISCAIRYLPPAGQLGAIAAKVLGKRPGFLMRQDLRRFKALLETGEIPTVTGAASAASPDYVRKKWVALRQALAREKRAS